MDEDTEESAVYELGNAGVGVETLSPATSADLTLLLEDFPHFVEIVLNEGVLGVILQASESRQRHAGILPATLLGEPSRGLGDDHDASAEGQGEEDSETDDDAPRGVRLFDLTNAIVDDVGDENANGDHELVRGDDGATDLTGRTLALEHGNTNGKVTNTQTGDETTHHHVDPGVHGGDLDDVANDEDEDTEGHGLAATPPVGSVGARQSTDERTDTHQGDEERLNDGNPLLVALGSLGEAVHEILEQKHGRNLASIVSEEETTDGSCHSQQDGLSTAVGAIDLDRPVAGLSVLCARQLADMESNAHASQHVGQ